MNETPSPLASRLLLSLAPVALSALVGQALYLLVWGIKLETRVERNEGRIAELRQQVDKVNDVIAHRIMSTSNKFGSIEEQMNEQGSRIDTLIALMKVRDRSDADYYRGRSPQEREERRVRPPTEP